MAIAGNCAFGVPAIESLWIGVVELTVDRLFTPAQSLLVKANFGQLRPSLVEPKQIENLFGRLAQNHFANGIPISEQRFLVAELAQFQERRVEPGPTAVAQVFPS